jgi:hypothetical protein
MVLLPDPKRMMATDLSKITRKPVLAREREARLREKSLPNIVSAVI